MRSSSKQRNTVLIEPAYRRQSSRLVSLRSPVVTLSSCIYDLFPARRFPYLIQCSPPRPRIREAFPHLPERSSTQHRGMVLPHLGSSPSHALPELKRGGGIINSRICLGEPGAAFREAGLGVVWVGNHISYIQSVASERCLHDGAGGRLVPSVGRCPDASCSPPISTPFGGKPEK
jgi:hypothetical protein